LLRKKTLNLNPNPTKMKRKIILCATVFTIILTQYLAANREQFNTKTIEVAEQSSSKINVIGPRTLVD